MLHLVFQMCLKSALGNVLADTPPFINELDITLLDDSRWRYISLFCVTRGKTSACVHKNPIYVIGGGHVSDCVIQSRTDAAPHPRMIVYQMLYCVHFALSKILTQQLYRCLRQLWIMEGIFSWRVRDYFSAQIAPYFY